MPAAARLRAIVCSRPALVAGLAAAGLIIAAVCAAGLTAARRMGAGPLSVTSSAASSAAAPAVSPAAVPAYLPAISARQQFVAPPPGSYRLPVIQQAPDGVVLDSDGRAVRLDRYTHGHITILSFIYTYCSDPNGCPLAWQVLSELRTRLLAAGALGQRVQLVSLSFDPGNDTPRMMQVYGGALARPDSPVRWHFLTTRSVAELKPIIDEFGQAVTVQYDGAGQPLRLYHHLLKVFLLDARGRVREIYSPAFLLTDVVWNDILTLDFEQGNSR